MAVLPNPDRAEVWADYIRQTTGLAVTKADLRAAVDAVDSWLNTNAASYNTAIPQPARSTLSASQKAKLLMHVVNKRFERGA